MSKQNYKFGKDLSDSICGILGVSRPVTHTFMRVIEEAIVHDVSCRSLDSEDKIDSFCIEIPFIGTVFMKKDGDKIHTVGMKLEDKFEEELVAAIDKCESPLMKNAESSMIRNLKSKYNSIL